MELTELKQKISQGSTATPLDDEILQSLIKERGDEFFENLTGTIDAIDLIWLHENSGDFWSNEKYCEYTAKFNNIPDEVKSLRKSNMPKALFAFLYEQYKKGEKCEDSFLVEAAKGKLNFDSCFKLKGKRITDSAEIKRRILCYLMTADSPFDLMKLFNLVYKMTLLSGRNYRVTIPVEDLEECFRWTMMTLGPSNIDSFMLHLHLLFLSKPNKPVVSLFKKLKKLRGEEFINNFEIGEEKKRLLFSDFLQHMPKTGANATEVNEMFDFLLECFLEAKGHSALQAETFSGWNAVSQHLTALAFAIQAQLFYPAKRLINERVFNLNDRINAIDVQGSSRSALELLCKIYSGMYGPSKENELSQLIKLMIENGAEISLFYNKQQVVHSLIRRGYMKSAFYIGAGIYFEQIPLLRDLGRDYLPTRERAELENEYIDELSKYLVNEQPYPFRALIDEYIGYLPLLNEQDLIEAKMPAEIKCFIALANGFSSLLNKLLESDKTVLNRLPMCDVNENSIVKFREAKVLNALDVLCASQLEESAVLGILNVFNKHQLLLVENPHDLAVIISSFKQKKYEKCIDFIKKNISITCYAHEKMKENIEDPALIGMNGSTSKLENYSPEAKPDSTQEITVLQEIPKAENFDEKNSSLQISFGGDDLKQNAEERIKFKYNIMRWYARLASSAEEFSLIIELSDLNPGQEALMVDLLQDYAVFTKISLSLADDNKYKLIIDSLLERNKLLRKNPTNLHDSPVDKLEDPWGELFLRYCETRGVIEHESKTMIYPMSNEPFSEESFNRLGLEGFKALIRFLKNKNIKGLKIQKLPESLSLRDVVDVFDESELNIEDVSISCHENQLPKEPEELRKLMSRLAMKKPIKVINFDFKDSSNTTKALELLEEDYRPKSDTPEGLARLASAVVHFADKKLEKSDEAIRVRSLAYANQRRKSVYRLKGMSSLENSEKSERSVFTHEFSEDLQRQEKFKAKRTQKDAVISTDVVEMQAVSAEATKTVEMEVATEASLQLELAKQKQKQKQKQKESDILSFFAKEKPIGALNAKDLLEKFKAYPFPKFFSPGDGYTQCKMAYHTFFGAIRGKWMVNAVTPQAFRYMLEHYESFLNGIDFDNLPLGFKLCHWHNEGFALTYQEPQDAARLRPSLVVPLNKPSAKRISLNLIDSFQVNALVSSTIKDGEHEFIEAYEEIFKDDKLENEGYLKRFLQIYHVLSQDFSEIGSADRTEMKKKLEEIFEEYDDLESYAPVFKWLTNTSMIHGTEGCRRLVDLLEIASSNHLLPQLLKALMVDKQHFIDPLATEEDYAALLSLFSDRYTAIEQKLFLDIYSKQKDYRLNFNDATNAFSYFITEIDKRGLRAHLPNNISLKLVDSNGINFQVHLSRILKILSSSLYPVDQIKRIGSLNPSLDTAYYASQFEHFNTVDTELMELNCLGNDIEDGTYRDRQFVTRNISVESSQSSLYRYLGCCDTVAPLEEYEKIFKCIDRYEQGNPKVDPRWRKFATICASDIRRADTSLLFGVNYLYEQIIENNAMQKDTLDFLRHIKIIDKVKPTLSELGAIVKLLARNSHLMATPDFQEKFSKLIKSYGESFYRGLMILSETNPNLLEEYCENLSKPHFSSHKVSALTLPLVVSSENEDQLEDFARKINGFTGERSNIATVLSNALEHVNTKTVTPIDINIWVNNILPKLDELPNDSKEADVLAVFKEYMPDVEQAKQKVQFNLEDELRKDIFLHRLFSPEGLREIVSSFSKFNLTDMLQMVKSETDSDEAGTSETNSDEVETSETDSDEVVKSKTFAKILGRLDEIAREQADVDLQIDISDYPKRDIELKIKPKFDLTHRSVESLHAVVDKLPFLYKLIIKKLLLPNLHENVLSIIDAGELEKYVRDALSHTNIMGDREEIRTYLNTVEMLKHIAILATRLTSGKQESALFELIKKENNKSIKDLEKIRSTLQYLDTYCLGMTNREDIFKIVFPLKGDQELREKYFSRSLPFLRKAKPEVVLDFMGVIKKFIEVNIDISENLEIIFRQEHGIEFLSKLRGDGIDEVIRQLTKEEDLLDERLARLVKLSSKLLISYQDFINWVEQSSLSATDQLALYEVLQKIEVEIRDIDVLSKLKRAIDSEETNIKSFADLNERLKSGGASLTDDSASQSGPSSKTNREKLKEAFMQDETEGSQAILALFQSGKLPLRPHQAKKPDLKGLKRHLDVKNILYDEEVKLSDELADRLKKAMYYINGLSRGEYKLPEDVLGKNLKYLQGKELSELTYDDIQNFFREYHRDSSLQKRSPLIAIALMREVMFRTTNGRIMPNTTQLLAVLLSLYTKGNLGLQILAGQGKTVTTAMLAALAYYSNSNRTIDVCTNDPVNAANTYKNDAKPFFDYLGVKSNVINKDSVVADYIIDGINYSTYSDIAIFRGRAKHEGASLRRKGDQKYQPLLVADEADTATLDNTQDFNYGIVLHATGKTNDEVNPLAFIYPYVMEYIESQKFPKDGICAQQIESFGRFLAAKSLNQSQLDTLKSVNPDQVNRWIQAALIANNLQPGVDYIEMPVTDEKKLRYADDKERAYFAYPLVNFRPQKDSTLSDGVQQCLHAKLNKEHKGERQFTIEPEISLFHSLNAEALLKYYERHDGVTALTGTLGSRSEVAIQKLRYGFTAFRVPTQEKDRLEIKPPIFTDESNEIKKIIQQIKNAGDRPVLVIAEDMRSAEDIFNELKNSTNKAVQAILGDDEKKDEDEKFEKAGNSGVVTVSTPVAGRGINIKLEKKFKQKGGLHVINVGAFGTRDVEQSNRRAGRMHQPGSAISIFRTDKRVAGLTANKGNVKKVIDALDKINATLRSKQRPLQLTKAIVMRSYDAMAKYFREHRDKYTKDMLAEVSRFKTAMLKQIDVARSENTPVYIMLEEVQKSYDQHINDLSQLHKENSTSKEKLQDIFAKSKSKGLRRVFNVELESNLQDNYKVEYLNALAAFDLNDPNDLNMALELLEKNMSDCSEIEKKVIEDLIKKYKYLIQQPIVNKLEKYIERANSHSPNFTFGFIVDKKTRGVSRKVNVFLAKKIKSLISECKDVDFTTKGIKELRDKVANECLDEKEKSLYRSNRGINSSELNEAINYARKIDFIMAKSDEQKTTPQPKNK